MSAAEMKKPSALAPGSPNDFDFYGSRGVITRMKRSFPPGAVAESTRIVRTAFDKLMFVRVFHIASERFVRLCTE